LLYLDNDSPGCQHGIPFLRFPIGAQRYHHSGIRKAYDILASLPPALNQTFFAFEGYSSKGVRDIPSDSTSFPDRHNDLLISSFVNFIPSPGLDEEARVYGEQMRAAIVEGNGTPLSAYVNYAYGTESQEEIYGYEPWRQEKLQRLKKEYDPENRFGFYNGLRTTHDVRHDEL
jgi:hypothetical protein